MDNKKYVCEVCNKIFKYHSVYLKHKNNKKSCGYINNDVQINIIKEDNNKEIIINKQIYKCELCNT